MISLSINGQPVAVEPGSTVLDAARFMGIPIPTLCFMEGLTPFGACRMCVVEIGTGPRAKLVASCVYPAEAGLQVRTSSARVEQARRMMIELYVASCPDSKVIQDLAAEYHVQQQRFRQEHESCIMCGLCVRYCAQQMSSGAIGFRGRGEHRSVGTPFDTPADNCRRCGGCVLVCPTCQKRCTASDTNLPLCGACTNLAPPCLARPTFHDRMCFMSPCVACEIKKSQ